jgi:hypothetical protein
MRLDKAAHTSAPWRIHEVLPDFPVEDVWAMPTPGGPDDFPRLVEMIVAGNPFKGSSVAVRALEAIRLKLGSLFGWDDPETGVGSRVESLQGGLPAELRQTDPPAFGALPFNSLYLLKDEFAAEAANRTMHGVLHLGWVREASGVYRGQLAILVKPNGLLGKLYMAAIKPFRHLIVYPTLMRQWERAWQRRYGPGAEAPSAGEVKPSTTRAKLDYFSRSA